MALVRWEPWREIDQLAQQMSKFLGYTPRVPAGETQMMLTDWVPAVDIEENNEEYVIRAELPGLKKEEVTVTFQDGLLALKGERKQEKEERGKRFHRVERSYGTFYRSFMIPTLVEETKIFAEHRDGVLYVHLPKSPEGKKEEAAIVVKVR